MKFAEQRYPLDSLEADLFLKLVKTLLIFIEFFLQQIKPNLILISNEANFLSFLRGNDLNVLVVSMGVNLSIYVCVTPNDRLESFK